MVKTDSADEKVKFKRKEGMKGKRGEGNKECSKTVSHIALLESTSKKTSKKIEKFVIYELVRLKRGFQSTWGQTLMQHH